MSTFQQSISKQQSNVDRWLSMINAECCITVLIHILGIKSYLRGYTRYRRRRALPVVSTGKICSTCGKTKGAFVVIVLSIVLLRKGGAVWRCSSLLSAGGTDAAGGIFFEVRQQVSSWNSFTSIRHLLLCFCRSQSRLVHKVA
jgi:hypothetical protein